MPRVVNFNGIRRSFPDDATDEEIAAALEAESPAADSTAMPSTIMPSSATSDDRVGAVTGGVPQTEVPAWLKTADKYVKPLQSGLLGAGAALAGGAGPVATTLMGAATAGLDPTSPHMLPTLGLNMFGGRAAEVVSKATKMRPFLQAVLGGGEIAGAQAAGNEIAASRGQTSEMQDPLLGFGAGIAGGLVIPPAARKFIDAYHNATPQVRAKIEPLIKALMGSAKQPSTPVNLAPMSAQEVATEAATLPHTMRTPVGDGGLSRTHEQLTSANEMEMRQRLAKWIEMNSIDPQSGINRDMVQKATNLYGNDADILIDRMRGKGPQLPPSASLEDTLAASLAARGIKPPPTPAAPSTDALTAQLEASLKARNVQPPSPVLPTPKPAPAPATQPTTTPAVQPPAAAPEARTIYDEADDALRKIVERTPNGALGKLAAPMAEKGIAAHIDSVLDGDLKELPNLTRQLDELLPGKGKELLRDRAIGKIMSGIGEAGAFGDLTPIQKLKELGGMDLGGKKGSQVINDIFDSPDAAHHLNNIYDAVEDSLEQQLRGQPKDWTDKLKVFWNKTGPVAGAAGLLGGGAFYFHLSPAIAATAAGVVGAPKVLMVTADKLGSMLGRSRSKWSDMILDLVRGSEKYTPAQINALISQLRKIGTEPDQSANEIDSRFMAQ